MNTILIFSIAVATAVADVHELHGAYHYDKPITSYGVPSFTVLNKYKTGSSTGSSSSLNTGFGSTLGSGTPVQSVGISTGQSSTGGGYSVGGSLGQTTGGYNTGYTVTGSSGQTFNTGFTSGNTGGYSGSLTGLSGNYQQSSGSGLSSGYQYQTGNQQSQNNYHGSSNAANYQSHYNFIQSGPPEILKHFYVHVAPEEPERPKFQQPIVLPRKQKHYNIIFVKTPTPPAGASHVIPVQQETEEKTIVYVLVQNPEEIKDVVLPKFTPKQPTKPEVFFIKYDGKDDAHGVINNIVNDYQKYDSVSFNGIGVNQNEFSGDNLSIKYGTPLPSSDSKYVSSTEGSNTGSNKFEISSIGTSSIGSTVVESSTPGYNSVGSTSSGYLATGGIGGFETGNEINIGSGLTNTGSGKYVLSSGKGHTNGGKFGGSSSYQTVQVETSNVDATSNGSNNFDTSSIRPIEITSVGPTSTLNAIITGNDISSTTSNPGSSFSSISTGLSVPFETYGPPQFKP